MVLDGVAIGVVVFLVGKVLLVDGTVGIFVDVISINVVILGTEVEVEDLDNVELMVDSVSVVFSSF